jgi:hypothetical protein
MTLVVVVFNFLVEPYFPMYNHRRRHDCGANHEINESDLNRKKFVSDDRAENVFIVSHFWMYRERCCKAPLSHFDFLGQFPFGVFFSRIVSKENGNSIFRVSCAKIFGYKKLSVAAKFLGVTFK